MSLFIANAQVITMDGESGSTPVTASIRIQDGVIAALGPDVRPEPGDVEIDGRDRLVAPGLVNAHTHSWETLFKGRFDNLPLELWMLFSYPILGNTRVDPDLVTLRSTLFAAESLKAGVTTVIDDVLETPDQDFDQLDAVVDAYDVAGIRANVSGHIINKPFVDTLPFVGELLESSLLDDVRAMPVPTTADYLDFSAEAFGRYRGRGGGRISYMVAPSGPQRCTDDLLTGATELAVAHGAECHIHVLETKTQAVTGPEFYGTTLVKHLDRIGALSANTTFAHGIWVTDEDIELIARAGVSVSHNPISNLKLGSGVLPWRQYLDAGVNLGLGSDGGSSSDSPRMLDVVKAAGLLHKISGPDYESWPTVQEVLHAATLGGARSGMLQDAVGSLEVGKRADLVIYDLKTLAFTPRNSLEKQLVYSENGGSIDYVIVDGEIVVDHGSLTTVDEEALIEEFAERRPQLQSWHDELEQLNQAFVPAFTQMHHRAQAQDIGFTRYLR
ncbi:amidohydrolase family protein [Citricoccus sp. GCM10030269]|uniref:amidohydrolase family protein n=1 Tax=Citricoccus sp. GCM10030269 TaxID=3273388 RepID=UPI00361BC1DA